MIFYILPTLNNEEPKVLSVYVSNSTNQFDLSEIDSICFVVIPELHITSIAPTSGQIGDEITITGYLFGSSQGTSFASFNGTNSIEYTSWNDTEIKVKVPSGATSGKLSITVNGTKSNEVDFTILATNKPQITNIYPSSAFIGDIVTITGSNFSSYQESGYVSFNGTVAVDYTSWSPTEIIVKVPMGTSSGKTTVTVDGTKSNEFDFTVLAPDNLPQIIVIIPNSSCVGNNITIYGTLFGSTKGTSNVSFNGANASEYTDWTSTSIIVKVPFGAKTGQLSLTVNGKKSNEVDFTVIPYITSLNPTSAKIGDEVTINGTGFGNTRGISIASFYGANAIEYNSWNDTIIVVKVPAGAETGKLSVTVGEQISNEVDFTVIPFISNINPSSAKIGDDIYIYGTGFGQIRGTSMVDISGTNVTEYTSWESNSIVVKVPAGASSGKLTVTVGVNKSNEFDFTVLPYISSINPTSGQVGSTVYISGTGFGTTKGTSYVKFNTTQVATDDYTSWSVSQIKVKVPTGATSGNVTVTVENNLSNGINFTISTLNQNEITIGTQTWMSTNLDVDHYRNGDTIPQVTDPTVWSHLTTGAWCYYDNNSSNGTTYGKLYNWYAVNDSRGLTPIGWHVPSNPEFTVLSTYLGGDNVAGGKLKEAGTTHWQSPNTGATNESSFSALSGGIRGDNGEFVLIGIYCLLWSSNEGNSAYAYRWSLYYNDTRFSEGSNYKQYGFSVRCIKD